MNRFFVSPDDIDEEEIRLSLEDSEHIRSLRLRPDEEFAVCDGHGTDYICCLKEITGNAKDTDNYSYAKIIKHRKSHGEAGIKCGMFIAYSKGDRLEYAIQKSVELGAHSILLYESSRCVVKADKAAKKIQRYQKIAEETAKQCNRGIIPQVTDIGSYDEAVITAAEHYDLAILCYEAEKNLHLQTVLRHFFPVEEDFVKPRRKVKSIAVITGPEGGFEPAEIKLAKGNDISVVSLGLRVLRCETAPVAVLAAIMYHTENL